ncbi:MAG: lipopolysaccharide biosynthesis protein [Opitutaceae bacterium]|nr:lipopolysaccharide biosynthesis protein [Opitutaceae bacterium]
MNNQASDARSLRQKVISALLWSAAQSWGSKLVGLLIFMVLARLLRPDELGTFEATLLVIGFVGMFIDQGLSEAVVQRPEIGSGQLNAVFLINMVMAIAITTGLLAGATPVAGLLGVPEAAPVICALSMGIPLTGMVFCQWALHRRNFNYRWLTVSGWTATLVSGIAAIVLAHQGFGVWSLVAQSLISNSVTVGMLWYGSRWRFSWEFDFAGVREMVHYGLARLGSTLLDFAGTKFIAILVATTLGPAALGLYAVGNRIYTALMQLLSAAVLDVAHNSFSRLAGDEAALTEAYYKAITVTSAAAVPVFVMTGALAPELTIWLFGAQWAESANVMRPLALLGAVQVMQFYNGTIGNAIGKPWIWLRLQLIRTVVVISVLLYVSGVGLDRMIWWFVGLHLAVTPLSFWLVNRVAGISIFRIARRTWPFLLGSGLMYATVAFSRPGLERLGCAVSLQAVSLSLAGGGAYGFVILLFAREPVRAILRLFRRHE